MKIFLLDLWHDLRAKRLWPVALVLAAGLVAVPVVLSKSSDSAPAPAPTEVAKSKPDNDALEALASVKLGESDGERGSTLGKFDPGDPFRPPKAIERRSRGDAGVGSSIAGQLGKGATSDGGGSDTGSSDLGSTGGETGSTGGDTGSTGGGDTGSTGGDGPDTPTTTQYTYVVDLTFTANGRTRRLEGMQRLDMLPSASSPLLLFLGVSANAGNAVFLVDSTLEAAGEGRCKPKASDCAFLYLGAGSEHEFTNEDGDSYTLRIDEIRKVEVGSSATSSRKSRSASAALGAPAAPRRFLPPMLADLVSVSSTDDAGSNDNDHRR
jgi:hypothetical protein